MPEVFFHSDLDLTLLTQEFLGRVVASDINPVLMKGWWRVVSIACWNYADDPRWAVIMHKTPLSQPKPPRQDLSLLVPAEELHLEVLAQTLQPTPMVPVLITTTGDQEDVLWSIVFQEPTGTMALPPEIRWDLSGTEVDAIQQDATDPRVITSFDVYYKGSELAFTALSFPEGGGFPGYPGKRPRIARRLKKVNVVVDFQSDAWEAIDKNEIMRRGWVRPDLVVPAPFDNAEQPGRGLFTQWYGDTLIPWPADMTDPDFDAGVQVRALVQYADVETTVLDMEADGYIPFRVGANGHGEYLRYCITFAKNHPVAIQPLPHQLVIVDARDATWPERVGGPVPEAPPMGPIYKGGLLKPERGIDPSGPTGSARLDPSFPKPRPEGWTWETIPDSAESTLPNLGPNWPTLNLNPLLLPSLYAQLDQAIRANFLEAIGARCVQVAVFRGDRLVIDRAYTLAEEGYPVATPRHMFWTGSFSKALTGMGAIRAFAPTGNLSELTETSAAVGFGFQQFLNPQNFNHLNATSIFHFVTRRAGLVAEFDETTAAMVSRLAPLPAIEGDLLSLFELEPNTIFTDPPGTLGPYTGGFIKALSDGIGHAMVGDRTLYSPALREWWFPGISPQDAPKVARQRLRQAEDLEQMGVPMHSSKPEVGWAHDVGIEPYLTPIQYADSIRFIQGAGGWAMSAHTLVRILCAMVPSANTQKPAFLAAQTQLILDLAQTEPVPALFSAYGGMSPGGIPYVRLGHNGSAWGCCAFGGVDFPNGSMANDSNDTTVISVLMNQDSRTGNINTDEWMTTLRTIVSEMEAIGFPPGDLFNA